VQVTGTFGGATIALQVSNDGTNYATLKDGTGTTITFTSAGMAEFSTAALYIKPSSSGGTADDVTVTVVLRG
jgi:P pilus assembly chaperone PapD